MTTTWWHKLKLITFKRKMPKILGFSVENGQNSCKRWKRCCTIVEVKLKEGYSRLMTILKWGLLAIKTIRLISWNLIFFFFFFAPLLSIYSISNWKVKYEVLMYCMILVLELASKCMKMVDNIVYFDLF